MKALILNYHLIDNQKYSFDNFGGIYAVREKDFFNQIELLHKLKIKVVSLNDIVNKKVDEDFCVAITVDDGNLSDYEIVYRVLQKFGYSATFFLSLSNMNKNEKRWKQYVEMKENGFSIGSHGVSHQDLTILKKDFINLELKQSIETIEEKIKSTISFFSLPFGRYNKFIVENSKQIGYNGLFSTQFKLIDVRSDNYIYGRWSIKRNTSISDFEKILKNNKKIIRKYYYISLVKKNIVSLFGSSLINKIYTIKNSLF